jgi:ribosomal-protein-alanine N-acetyltransferase
VEALRTERLVPVALTPELARAALEDKAQLGRLLGARVPETWPGADFAIMLPRIARGSEEASSGAELTRLVVHAADGTLIGETGFHGPPDGSGTVEVGYSIVPAYRGRGFAAEATRALNQHVLARPGIRRITAECLDDNVASMRVLEKLGMRRVGRAGGTLRFEMWGGKPLSSLSPGGHNISPWWRRLHTPHVALHHLSSARGVVRARGGGGAGLDADPISRSRDRSRGRSVS